MVLNFYENNFELTKQAATTALLLLSSTTRGNYYKQPSLNQAPSRIYVTLTHSQTHFPLLPLAPTNKMTDNKELACKPLKTLEEILDWDPTSCSTWEVRPLQKRTALSSLGTSQCCHQISSQLRPPKLFDRTTVPRTLVCHDMKGGYLDDRFVYGSDKHTDYRFFHWAGIDIFVYFSHQLLTIPPPVWVNAAHLHGVLILGTLITEWDAGRPVLERLLRSGEAALQNFATQLATISECYGLDGWLLNVENALAPEDVPRLQQLVSILTKTMHARIPHSQVIWYDSITTSGELKWQNELNEQNRPLRLPEPMIFPLPYLVLAGYMNAGLWSSSHLWNIHSGGVSGLCFTSMAPHNCLMNHPSAKALDCGYTDTALYVVSELPWHNLSQQQPQPCLPACVTENGDPPTTGGPSPTDGGEQLRGCVQHWASDAFLGGGCLLLLRPVNLNTTEPVIHRLLLCSFDVTESLLVSFALKSPVPELKNTEMDFSLWLLCQNVQRGSFRHYLVPVKQEYRIIEVCAILGPRTARILLGWLAIQEFTMSK
ncbi:hypothetical protein B566_EDAN012018 [Ephemera danica]|nr:hypothetical protein B566_EDAN012018 [Ephemera danica]